NSPCSERAARRVGTRMVTSASASGSLAGFAIAPKWPASSASTKVGRKGVPGGIVKTRGADLAIPASGRAFQNRQFGLADRLGRADMQPCAIHADTEQTTALDRAVEQDVERERAFGRIREEAR